MTPLDPFLQMYSLREHHVPDRASRTPRPLCVSTRVGPAAVHGHAHLKGTLEAGLPADLALLDRDPVTTGSDELLDTEVLRHVDRGPAGVAARGGRGPMNTDRAFERPLGRLRIDREAVDECRELADEISQPIEELARTHTTVSIERASLRLVGVDGVEGEGVEAVPMPNRVVDEVRDAIGLERGVLIPFFHAVEAGCGRHPERGRGDRLAASSRPAWPEGIDLEIADRARQAARADSRRRSDRSGRRRSGAEDRDGGGRPQAVVLPDRRDRQHPRGHPAGQAAAARTAPT